MDVNTVPNPTAPPQQAAPAAPVVMESTPQYVAPQQMPLTPSQPAAAPNNTLEFFKDINWFEVTFMFLGALALIKTIDYYSYKKKEDKTTYYDVQRRMDKQEQRLTANESDTANIVQMLEGNGGNNGLQPLI